MRARSRFLSARCFPAHVLACLTILSSFLLAAPADAQDAAPGGSEKRIALVVGNADYKAGALATPANDAGLVAQTLQAAGFDVVGARDLDEDALRKAMRDFTDKAAASGPDTVAFVYLSGYGLQLNGENYFAPIDAEIASAADVPVQSLRISDYKRRLASIPLKARFVVLDAARNNPFVKSGDPLAGGLALTEADPGSLVAFNAAPGTVGPEEKGPYGAYAQALAEMIREGGLAPDQLFDRVRLRVSETTQGGEVPWNAGKLEPGFVFFQRAADAPKLADPETVSALETRPLKELGAKEAYSAALKRDTLQGYQEFADAYPREPVTKRVRALAATRRESQTWRRSYQANSPDGYWSYLSRYPRGPHAYDCRRRLRELSVALEPPPRYAAIDYDIPPPPPEEIVYVERPVVYFDDPIYDLPPPPPPPVVYLAPPPAYIVDLAPPPPVYDYYALPVPAFAPLPVYVEPPVYIAAPVNNVYFTNIHNTVVIEEINRGNREFSERRRLDPTLAIGAGAVAGAALGLAAARVALPANVQKRAVDLGPPPTGTRNPQVDMRRRGGPDQANRPANADAPGGRPGSGQPNREQSSRDQTLPGQNGQPLPQANKPGQPALGPDGKPLQPGKTGQPPLGPDGKPLPQQANKPDQPALGPDGKPVQQQTGKPALGPDGKPLPQQANKPGQPTLGPDGKPVQQQMGKPGQPALGPDGKPNQQQTGKPGQPVLGPDGKPVPQQADKPGQPTLGPDGKPLQQANKPEQPGLSQDGKPGQQQTGKPGQPALGPDGKPLPQQANKPGQPVSGPDGKPSQEAAKPGDKTAPVVGPGGKPLPVNPGVVGQKGSDGPDKGDKPGGPNGAGANGKATPQQAGKLNPPVQPDAPNGKPVGQPGVKPGLPTNPNLGAAKPQTPPVRVGAPDQPNQQAGDKLKPSQDQRQQAQQAAQQRLQAEQAQKQQAAQQKAAQQQAQQAQRQQQAQQAAQQQAQQAQKQQQAQQAAQQRAAQQQAQKQQQAQQAAQQRAAQQQAQQAQRQQMMQQQQQQAAQQRQMQQQQAAQQRQMMQQQQQAQQRQMMMQQQAAQRQQQMSRPPPGGGGGGHGCRPGQPCR